MANEDLKEVLENLDLLLNIEILAQEPDWKMVKELDQMPEVRNKKEKSDDGEN